MIGVPHLAFSRVGQGDQQVTLDMYRVDFGVQGIQNGSGVRIDRLVDIIQLYASIKIVNGNLAFEVANEECALVKEKRRRGSGEGNNNTL